MQICGQHFTPEIIERIQDQLEQTPEISRRALSHRVCEWLDWRASNDKWQEGSCRKALLKLDRLNQIHLPQTHNPFACLPAPPPPMILESATFRGELKELGEVELIPVGDRRSSLAKTWKAMLDRDHYLGSGPLCGAQVKYVIRSEHAGDVGALAFSSACWALQARDQFIGWSEAARQAQLNRVITNSRFLILPGIQVANLASHVLSVAVKQVAKDWEVKYQVKPVLVETFIDPSRFNGSCYRAANWRLAGRSAGRRDGQCKEVLLYPLCPQWRQILCQSPAVRLGSVPKGIAHNWAEEEFGRLRVYDKRLRQRLCVMAQDFFSRPQANIPEACGSKARAMGAYRFLQNQKITMDVILTPHVESTIERIREHPVVLAPQDTTSLNYTAHPGTQGLGPISTLSDSSVGLLLHDTLAFTEQGTPLGVIDAQCWARDPEDRGKSQRRKQLPIEEKESNKWLKSYRRLREIQALCPDTTLISIGDREADLYELFVEATQSPDDPRLLVRSERSRRRKTEEKYLWDQMAKQTPAGALKLHLPKRGNQPSRTATVELRYAEVTLKPPGNKSLAPISLSAVYLVELEPEPGIEPIEWMLLTTIEVKDFDQARKCVEWYAGRWAIEVYHRTLKSGCRIRDRQLGTADRIQTCLGLDMVIAWRILHLTMLGREVPDQPCSVFFEEIEWKALHCHHYKVAQAPPEPPSLMEAIKMVGAIGGHLGRKSDGFPGAQCIWRGLQRLDAAVDMYAIMRNESLPKISASYPHTMNYTQGGP